jgi:ADP-ribosylglycohydrolase
MSGTVSLKARVFGGLLGAAIGDALGLPFEGAPREWLDQDPIEGIAGGGPHGQPAGAWSDDSSLLFCLAESLCSGYDPDDIGAKFLAWWTEGLWTPYGRAFGFGHATAAAMHKMMVGIPPLKAGQSGEGSNANGSLMRTLPVALYFHRNRDLMLKAAHQVSSISHAHPRSLMCCGIYCLVASSLLRGADRREAVEDAVRQANEYYRGPPWDDERVHLESILSLEAIGLDRFQVKSGSYVVETLEAALWSLVRGDSFRHALLVAVNLGGDTDTVGAVTGGLAGVCHGRDGVPEEWLEALARSDDILDLCERFWRAANSR